MSNMQMQFFFKYRGKLMKLVNKLSVVSLIVLMFSFMYFANAGSDALCRGTQVSNCGKSTTQSACESTWRGASGTPFQQCAWDASTSVCRANGNACSTNNWKPM